MRIVILDDSGARLEEGRPVVPDCVLLDYRLPDTTGLNLTATDLKLGMEKAVQNAALLRALEAERDRLARSVAEKEILLREVHHRVKNNFQVIGSLLRLQADAVGDHVVANALRESQLRVEAMALIHEQLHGSDLHEVDLARHAARLAGNLFDSYGVDPARISLRVGIEPLPVGIDRAIPAGLILNELISNALKHGFPGERRGSIWMAGHRDKGSIRLAVRDDGIGAEVGVDLERSKSLGLKIVRTLIKQLKGAFELDFRGGTTARLSFPETG